MKYLLLLTGCLLSLTVVQAQDSTAKKPTKPTFFVTAFLGYANKGVLGGGSANILFPSQFGFYLRGFSNQYKSKLLPADYKPRISLFGQPMTPSDLTNVYSIGVIKEITLKKTNYLYKAGLELGPCISFNQAKQFTPANNRGGWAFFPPSNYDFTIKNNDEIGLLIRPKLKLLGTENWGVELASSIVLTKSSPFYGIEINITSGSVNLKKKKKANK